MIYVARNRLCFGVFFEGLPPPPDADFSLSWSSGSLSDWKQRLWYGERGDDWEKAFEKGRWLKDCLLPSSHLASRHLQKDTGMTLLKSLVAANSLQAVQEYVYV